MRRTARGRIGLPALAIVLVALLCGHASADRRRVRIGLQPMYAVGFVDRRDPSGGGVGMDLAFGVTDSLSVRASGFVSFHSADGRSTGSPGAEQLGPGGTMSVFGAFAGINYSLNVLRIVPSFDLGIGTIGLRGDARFGTDAAASALLPPITAFAVELGFGTDWLITRVWSVGFVVRYHALLSTLNDAPSFLYIGPRASVSLPF